MKWEHVCSLEWMKARQQYLCASEVKQLIPFTKTGRDRKITDIDRMKIYINKIKVLATDDCVSFGAAARGHILEPFAIDELNAYIVSQGMSYTLEHWDDVIVHTSPYTLLAYSPDAMNNAAPDLNVVEVMQTGATVLGEVKSYSPERHIEAICTPANKLEERWQIATAFASDGHLSEAWLIFYNPSLRKDSVGIFHYDRIDLADEINTISQIEMEWRDFLNRLNPTLGCSGEALYVSHSILDEEEIIKRLEAKGGMNP